MKFTAAAVLAIATGAAAWGNETYVTETVDVYTTYCPGPTEITHGTKTWTVTEVRLNVRDRGQTGSLSQHVYANLITNNIPRPPP